MSTITSREFNHDVGSAKRAAARGPVIVTDRGEPAFVLMTIQEFDRLRGATPTIVDLLRSDDVTIEFEPERFDLHLRTPDL